MITHSTGPAVKKEECVFVWGGRAAGRGATRPPVPALDSTVGGRVVSDIVSGGLGTVLGAGGSSLVAGRGGLGRIGLETTSGGGVVLGLDGGGGVFTAVEGRMVGFPWSPVGGWSMEEEREHLEVVELLLSVDGGLLEQPGPLVDTPVPAPLLLLVFSSSHSSHM